MQIEWLMLQNRSYYVALNPNARSETASRLVIGIIHNIGDIETDPKKGLKQRWYGTALLPNNTWVSCAEMETFSATRTFVNEALLEWQASFDKA